jgi:two-component system cell cycle sensor histidine kinase/response regulator CckA
MIVDDNPANLKLLEDMLLQQGYNVRSFPLGRLALASAERNPPDLILLDINMPEMNGYEVCHRLKSIETLSEIPVIFLSALNDTEDKMKAFRSGAVDYISKPFHLEEVHARVETHLKLYRLQQALKLQNAHLEESAADIVIRLELFPHLHVAYINLAATVITGYSPKEYYANPDLILNIVHPDDRQQMESLLRGGFPSGSTVTWRCVHRNGDQVWIEQHNRLVKDPDGRLIAIDGIARDITERKHLEEQLRQAQKMEAVGLLAGGVAHDFNNLLTIILGYSDLVLDDKRLDVQSAEKIVFVRQAAEQGARLTRQLLAFGRRQLVQLKVLDLNAVVEGNARLLHRVIGEDIELVTTLAVDLAFVKVDAAQIEQILMNLAVNAKDAMPQGGKINIETRNVTVGEARAAGALAGNPESFVLLAVSDTGCGMDESTQARIFEPFYTTKETGKGTGLGLSIVYGIVKQSGGHIRILSKPGMGARFEILLPSARHWNESPEPTVVATERQVPSETILVVEDNPEVRELIGAVLHNQGYEVLLATDGNMALRICDEYEGTIGLILTDLIMPVMSGPTLVESLRQRNCGIRVLYMSGYAGNAVVSGGRLDSEIPFIQKPFTTASLTRKIRDILDGTATLDPTMKA